jgi:hypothetical protein
VRIKDRVYHTIGVHSQANARWSYSDPPLAQLPGDLRDLYMPDPGWPWFCWDHDQIELRIVACEAHDPLLLEGFEKNWDVHTLEACAIFGLPVPPDKTDPSHGKANATWRMEVRWQKCDHPRDICGKDDPRRKFAKTHQYRKIYGGSSKKSGDMPSAKAMNLKAKDLADIGRAWELAHGAIVQWQKRLGEQARTTRTTRTFLGRRRIYNGHASDIAREACDHPAQAGAQGIESRIFLDIASTWGYYRGDGGPEEVVYKFGAHDSMKWGIKEDRWEMITPRIREIVTRPWTINGSLMPFPASFKEVRA